MKMTKILSFVLVLIMIASCFAACGGNDETTKTPEPQIDLTGTYDITMWVSEKEGVDELTQQQIRAFEAANPGIKINATITGVSESQAAGDVLLDVPSAPDIYCFAQDQLARLVQADALLAPNDSIANALRTANDAGSVGAATVGGKLYAYPMTSDNGYFMYYDSSIITNPESLEDIIRDVEAYNEAHPEDKKWIRFGLENGWYVASFFFATGCESVWTTDDEGQFTALHDTFNSEAGLVAMQGMMKLTQSSAYNPKEDTQEGVAVWINGTWNVENAQEELGENFAATDLPSFTVDGKSYHLGSFTGNKLMGVKPQADSKRALVLSLLAQFLTNEQCQLERFESQGWGPSNLNAQQNEAVQADPSLAALALQSAYGQPQCQIAGGWWDLAATLGADAKTAKSVDDLKTALEVYEEAVNALVTAE